MLKRTISLFRETISGAAALEDLAAITACHRIQSSPGYRQAAYIALDRLRDAGVPAEIFSFPGDGNTAFWGYAIPQEWEGREGRLSLVAPEQEARALADFRAEKISMIQRSAPTPPEGVTAEVVVLEDGEEESDYEGLDLHGKVVLTRGDLERVRRLAVGKHGAAGILFDGMREAPPVRPLMGLPHARQYTSFWWEGTAEELSSRCWGFVLTPEQGEWLRRLVRTEGKVGRTVQVHATVDSSFCAGYGEDVVGYIAGETDEEVWLLAHLCHPQPSCNDNGSGVAALLETARALSHLIEQGKLPRPRRGIRFLLIPEMTGTYAYLATHEELIPHVVAGLNLDMVGEDQAQCGSTLNLTNAPRSCPSVSDDLLALIFQRVAAEGAGFQGVADYALFRWMETPFSAGSDHFVLTDPTVGIPCPMLLQWPDRFYHTSADTIDKVDPAMLARVGVAAATYLWWFANAGLPEARWLGSHMVTRAEGEVGRMRQAWMDGLLDAKAAPEELGAALQKLQGRVDLVVRHRVDSLALLPRLAGAELPALGRWQEQVRSAGARELERAAAALRAEWALDEIPAAPAAPRDGWTERAAHLAPRRLTRGPLSLRNQASLLTPEEQELWRALNKALGHGVAPILAVYWTDGKRTLLEIADLVERESGERDVRALVQYFELVAKMGLIELAAL